MNCPYHSISLVHEGASGENVSLEAIKTLAPYFLHALRNRISQSKLSAVSLLEIIHLVVESEDEMRAKVSKKYSDIVFRGNTLKSLPPAKDSEEKVFETYHEVTCSHTGKKSIVLHTPDFVAGTSFLMRLFYVIETLLQQQGNINRMYTVIHHPRTLAFMKKYMTLGKQRLSPIMGELYGHSGVEEFDFEHIYTPLEEKFFYIGEDSRGEFLGEDELLQGIRQKVSATTKTGSFSPCPVFGTTMFSELYETLFEMYLLARNIKSPNFPS